MKATSYGKVESLGLYKQDTNHILDEAIDTVNIAAIIISDC